jgi:hypothetical protein
VPYTAAEGTIEYFIRELSALHADVSALGETRDLAPLRRYILREDSMEFPCIYNWVTMSPLEWKDAVSHRNQLTLNLSVRISVGRVDSDEMVLRLLRYADCVRDVYLPVFRAPQPLNNASKWADMPSLQFVQEDFADLRVPTVEFVVSAQLIRPTTPIT